MRSTTCDKCKMTTTERNPKACGWVERAVEGHSYIDLCPECAKEFDKVKDSAWNAFNATIKAWLGCVTKEVNND